MADDPQKPPADSGRIPSSPQDRTSRLRRRSAAGRRRAAPEAAGCGAEPPRRRSRRRRAGGGRQARGARRQPAAPLRRRSRLRRSASRASCARPPPPPARLRRAKAAPHPPPAAPPPTGPPDPPPPADMALPAFIASLQAAMPGARDAGQLLGRRLDDHRAGRRTSSRSRGICATRRTRAFDFCSDVTATDWPPRAERFDVIYCLYSTRHRHRVRVKAEGRRAPAGAVGHAASGRRRTGSSARSTTCSA